MGDAGRARRPSVVPPRLRSRPRTHLGRSRESGVGLPRVGAPVLVLLGGLLWSAGLLFSQARQLYFFGDDWAFLVGPALEGSLLEPHNEHWSSLPLIAYRVMVRLFGIDHYVIWALMPILLHLAVGVLLYLLLRRHSVPGWSASLATLVPVLLAGSIAEDALWPFQIGFLGSVVLGLLALLLYDTSWSRVAMVWVLTVLSMACSGIALAMMVWLGLRVWLSHGLARALAATVPPFSVYAAWYVVYGGPSGTPAGPRSLGSSIDFVWAGVGSLWQDVLGLPGVGGPFLLVLLAVVALSRAAPDRVARLLGMSGLGAAVALYGLISINRGYLGEEGAVASRYAYVGLVMTVPAFALLVGWVAERLNQRPRETVVAGLVTVALMVVTGTGQTIAFRQYRQSVNPDRDTVVLSAVAFLRGGKPVVENGVVDPVYSPDLSVENLRRPGVLARFPQVEPSTQVELDGAVALQASVSSGDPGFPLARGLKQGGVTGTTEPVTGCAEVNVTGEIGYVDLQPSSGGSQVIIVPNQPAVQLQMVGREGLSVVRVVPVTVGRPVHVSTVSRDRALRVLLPPGETTFCSYLP